ncbi:MAG: hypothetical protein OSJ73_05790 [Lachnospiraceae bacterium]|nr:hypothetical protein [Lachnospiraceae bacterium]
MVNIIFKETVQEQLQIQFFTKEQAKAENYGKFFEGDYLQTCLIPVVGGTFRLLVGVGDGVADWMEVKNVYAKAVNASKTYTDALTLSILTSDQVTKELAGKERKIIGAALEGLLLACYRPTKYKSDQDTSNIIREIVLCGVMADEENRRILDEKKAFAEGIYFARDAVNSPSNLLRPMEYAKRVKELFKGLPAQVEIYDHAALVELGMEALLTVGKGSSYEPCLTVIRYLPQKDGVITALVGKGVTVDTGGYCVKAANSMEGIKGDMAGSAGVVAAMYALAKAGGTKNTVAVIPMCENRISPDAMLPGDVISSYNGKTIEILNTDAEGRLILADAVAFAVRHEQAQRVLDIATLTGAAGMTFGKHMAPMLADGEEFYEEFVRAQEISGEHYVRLPFYKVHERMIESKWADVKNTGGDTCGTITAGLFIRVFAEGRQWIHLDIAGIAESYDAENAPAFYSYGGTGAGASTMYALCC